MFRRNETIERGIEWLESILVFCILFVYCGAPNVFCRTTKCFYLGDGTFKCERCGWRGTGAEMKASTVGTLCPGCHNKNGRKTNQENRP